MISFAIGNYHSDSSVENGNGRERGFKEPDGEAPQPPRSDGGAVLLQCSSHQLSGTVLEARLELNGLQLIASSSLCQFATLGRV